MAKDREVVEEGHRERERERETGISVRYDLWPVHSCGPYAAYSSEQGVAGQKLPGSGIFIDSKVLTDIGRAFWAMAGLGGSRL